MLAETVSPVDTVSADSRTDAQCASLRPMPAPIDVPVCAYLPDAARPVGWKPWTAACADGAAADNARIRQARPLV